MASANVKIHINCGCGYKTDSLEEAVKHAEEKKHCLTVLGEVRPVDK